MRFDNKPQNLLVTITVKKTLALSIWFSPFSNIILRLFRGTLGFSESGTSADVCCPSKSLLGFISMSVRSSSWAGCRWLEVDSQISESAGSVSWSCESLVLFRMSGCVSICDASLGLGPADWLRRVWGLVGLECVVWGWGLWLDNGCCCCCFCCCCSQRFFKILRFPPRSVDGRGSATYRVKEVVT